MHMLRAFAICGLLLVTLTACTSTVPRKNLPYPLTNNEFDDPVKVVTVPLPVIAATPNEGIIWGGLTAFLLHDRRDEVSTLVAPQINQNENFGTTFTLYGAFYPSSDRNWETNLSKSTRINEDYELKVRDKTFMEKKLELNSFIFAFSDGSSRFFGFQSDSHKENETNYTNKEIGFTLSAGYEIYKNLQVVVSERFRNVDIKRGAVTSLPFITDVFNTNEVPGIEGFTAHSQKLALVYNTLDSLNMPTKGVYAKAAIEGTTKPLGSSATYRHYEFEVKGLLPLENARYITVARAAYNQTLGEDVPFLERSILGGETTLRGYGRNRFIDSSYILLNLEERIRLFRWTIFNVTADWEVAPFFDLGAVCENLPKVQTRNYEFNPGIGFRAVVRPNIVGRVDIGFGNEGPAVFVGLGYPF